MSSGAGSWLGLDRLSSRDRRAVTLGLLVVVPGLLWMTVVRPYRAALSSARDQVAAERALLERERALLASGPRVLHELGKARRRAEGSEERLVSAANTALAEGELIDYLETVAALSRVLLEEIRTVPPPRGEVAPVGLQPLRLAVRGESDLEGILTFLETIETNPLLLRIGGLTLEPEMERAQRRNGEGAPSPARPTGVVELGVVLEAYARPVDSDGPETDGSDEGVES